MGHTAIESNTISMENRFDLHFIYKFINKITTETLSKNKIIFWKRKHTLESSATRSLSVTLSLSCSGLSLDLMRVKWSICFNSLNSSCLLFYYFCIGWMGSIDWLSGFKHSTNQVFHGWDIDERQCCFVYILFIIHLYLCVCIVLTSTGYNWIERNKHC